MQVIRKKKNVNKLFGFGRNLKEDTAIYPDTCYLLSIAKSEYSFKDSILRLAELGTVIFMNSVLEEFKVNVKRVGLDSNRISSIMNDLSQIQSMSQSSSNICVEEHAPSDDEVEGMKAEMRNNSSKRNERVGAGEASIVSHINAIYDMFSQYLILSDDSDVSCLAQRMPRVQVFSSA